MGWKLTRINKHKNDKKEKNTLKLHHDKVKAESSSTNLLAAWMNTTVLHLDQSTDC